MFTIQEQDNFRVLCKVCPYFDGFEMLAVFQVKAQEQIRKMNGGDWENLAGPKVIQTITVTNEMKVNPTTLAFDQENGVPAFFHFATMSSEQAELNAPGAIVWEKLGTLMERFITANNFV